MFSAFFSPRYNSLYIVIYFLNFYDRVNRKSYKCFCSGIYIENIILHLNDINASGGFLMLTRRRPLRAHAYFLRICIHITYARIVQTTTTLSNEKHNTLFNAISISTLVGNNKIVTKNNFITILYRKIVSHFNGAKWPHYRLWLP